MTTASTLAPWICSILNFCNVRAYTKGFQKSYRLSAVTEGLRNNPERKRANLGQTHLPTFSNFGASNACLSSLNKDFGEIAIVHKTKHSGIVRLKMGDMVKYGHSERVDKLDLVSS